MHDISHIERILIKLIELASESDLDVNYELTEAALYFHDIIYSDEESIRTFLSSKNLSSPEIEHIIKIVWESQKDQRPTTNEG